MTEEEWLKCADSTPMLEFLQGKASDRKLRLFVVGCCRRICHLLSDDIKRAVEQAESFSDRLISKSELRRKGNGLGRNMTLWQSEYFAGPLVQISWQQEQPCLQAGRCRGKKAGIIRGVKRLIWKESKTGSVKQSYCTTSLATLSTPSR